MRATAFDTHIPGNPVNLFRVVAWYLQVENELEAVRKLTSKAVGSMGAVSYGYAISMAPMEGPAADKYAMSLYSLNVKEKRALSLATKAAEDVRAFAYELRTAQEAMIDLIVDAQDHPEYARVSGETIMVASWTSMPGKDPVAELKAAEDYVADLAERAVGIREALERAKDKLKPTAEEPWDSDLDAGEATVKALIGAHNELGRAALSGDITGVPIDPRIQSWLSGLDRSMLAANFFFKLASGEPLSRAAAGTVSAWAIGAGVLRWGGRLGRWAGPVAFAAGTAGELAVGEVYDHITEDDSPDPPSPRKRALAQTFTLESSRMGIGTQLFGQPQLAK